MSSLYPQARQLIELRDRVSECLPPALRAFVSVANFKQGKVVLFSENSAVASKLRLLAPSLRDSLMKNGIEVTAIDVQVQPARTKPRNTPKHAQLTPAALASLRAFSQQLPDSALRNAVNSILQRNIDRG